MAIKYTSFLGAPAKDKYMKVRMTFQSCLLLPAKETLGSLSSWGRVMSVKIKFCRDHRLKIFLSESLNALICNVKPPNKCKTPAYRNRNYCSLNVAFKFLYSYTNKQGKTKFYMRGSASESAKAYFIYEWNYIFINVNAGEKKQQTLLSWTATENCDVWTASSEPELTVQQVC